MTTQERIDNILAALDEPEPSPASGRPPLMNARIITAVHALAAVMKEQERRLEKVAPEEPDASNARWTT